MSSGARAERSNCSLRSRCINSMAEIVVAALLKSSEAENRLQQRPRYQLLALGKSSDISYRPHAYDLSSDRNVSRVPGTAIGGRQVDRLPATRRCEGTNYRWRKRSLRY